MKEWKKNEIEEIRTTINTLVEIQPKTCRKRNRQETETQEIKKQKKSKT